MNRQEVLVDTVFLEKLSDNGKKLDNFKNVLSELGHEPVVHPYIAANELDMFPYFNKLVDEGFVRVASYDEFLNDDADKELYESHFIVLHNKLREHLDDAGGKKRLEELILPAGIDIFEYRKAGMSLGDIHMILMAFFTKMPIVLTEDSDISILRSLTRRMMTSDTYTLNIYNAVDLLKMIAGKDNPSLKKDELINIAKSIGARKYLSDLKQIWNNVHIDT